MDGCALGVAEAPKTWHLLKFAALSDKDFKSLTKKGVQKDNPLHYGEMMVVMGINKLRRSLYIATNKNTDELYSERIRYDKAEYDSYLAKAGTAIKATVPPKRAYKANSTKCRDCQAGTICRITDACTTTPAFPVPALSCKQCLYATPLFETDDALWRCNRHNRNTTPTQPCEDMLCLPEFFSAFATVTESSTESTEYKNISDGTIWIHGKNKEAGEFSAKTLMNLPISMLNNPAVAKTQAELGGHIEGFEVEMPATLLDAYPWEDSRLRWSGDASKLAGAWCIEFLTDMKDEVPISTSQNEHHNAAEFIDHRLAVIYSNGQAAIWKGIM